jgi:hypothetical protein
VWSTSWNSPSLATPHPGFTRANRPGFVARQVGLLTQDAELEQSPYVTGYTSEIPPRWVMFNNLSTDLPFRVIP